MTDRHHSKTARALESEFGGRWGIWTSNTGRWWASRRQALSATQTGAGCKPFVHADTAEELAGHLSEQARLDPSPERSQSARPVEPAGATVD